MIKDGRTKKVDRHESRRSPRDCQSIRVSSVDTNTVDTGVSFGTVVVGQLESCRGSTRELSVDTRVVSRHERVVGRQESAGRHESRWSTREWVVDISVPIGTRIVGRHERRRSTRESPIDRRVLDRHGSHRPTRESSLDKGIAGRYASRQLTKGSLVDKRASLDTRAVG